MKFLVDIDTRSFQFHQGLSASVVVDDGTWLLYNFQFHQGLSNRTHKYIMYRHR